MTHAFIDGKDQGEVYKKRGRWHWHRGGMAVESYSRSAVLGDVREHIARLNRVPVESVQFKGSIKARK